MEKSSNSLSTNAIPYSIAPISIKKSLVSPAGAGGCPVSSVRDACIVKTRILMVRRYESRDGCFLTIIVQKSSPNVRISFSARVSAFFGSVCVRFR